MNKQDKMLHYAEGKLSAIMDLLSDKNQSDCSCCIEFSNDLFEVYPYATDIDCDCGVEEEWMKYLEHTGEHSEDCYQSDIDRMGGVFFTLTDQALKDLCQKHNIPWDDGNGSMVHCTCGKEDSDRAWEENHPHRSKCAAFRPNFKSGQLEIRWYKHIGRGMEIKGVKTMKELAAILNKCEASLLG